jgi:hypothetical protein
MAKAMVVFLLDQPKAGFFIDMAGGGKQLEANSFVNNFPITQIHK